MHYIYKTSASTYIVADLRYSSLCGSLWLIIRDLADCRRGRRLRLLERYQLIYSIRETVALTYVIADLGDSRSRSWRLRLIIGDLADS